MHDAVFFGSPGITDAPALGPIAVNGNPLHDLQVPTGHAYDLAVQGDPIARDVPLIGRYGPAPQSLDGMNQLSTDAAVTPDGQQLTASHGHSEYTTVGTSHGQRIQSTSEYNLSAVVAGMPQYTVAGSQEMKLVTTVAGFSLLIFVLAGCDDSPSSQYLDNTYPSETSTMSLQQQFGQLRERPTLEETTSHSEEMRQKIADALTQKFAVTDWGKRDSPATSTGCGSSYSVDDYDARAFVAQIWYSKTPVTYGQWPQAKSLVSEIANNYGFSAVALVIDKPEDMDLELNDSYGGKLTFGSAVNTSLSFRTGCHLTDEAKERGMPRPTS